MELRESPEGLMLVDGEMSMVGDFTHMLPRLKHNNLTHELLVKAAKIKNAEEPLTVIDATAGMGEDSLLLAAAGFEVYLFEQDPVIAALLSDTLKRSADIPALKEIVARMHFLQGDSISAMRNIAAQKNVKAALSHQEPDIPEASESAVPAPLNSAVSALPDTTSDSFTLPDTTSGSFMLPACPDVIYLDPMFPQRTKSAMIKKKFQLIHQLERPCDNEEALLEAALAAGPRKIVIKRPLKGPFLAGRKPNYSQSGKAVRYDCILLPR